MVLGPSFRGQFLWFGGRNWASSASYYGICSGPQPWLLWLKSLVEYRQELRSSGQFGHRNCPIEFKKIHVDIWLNLGTFGGHSPTLNQSPVGDSTCESVRSAYGNIKTTLPSTWIAWSRPFARRIRTSNDGGWIRIWVYSYHGVSENYDNCLIMMGKQHLYQGLMGILNPYLTYLTHWPLHQVPGVSHQCTGYKEMI